jgi:hypothetical protein
MRADTLRLRLTRSEVDLIGNGQDVAETTHFPDGSELSYVMVPGQQCNASLSKTERGQEIRIEVPTSDARIWAGSDEVGFSGADTIQIGPLEILIEKDFTCVSPREGEEDLDTFPNPNVQAAAVPLD